MATQEQIEANRHNARKSTGPRTAAGKARSSQNATAHGLAGETVVMYGEDPAAFRAFHAALTADVAPRGALEALLVERIAGAAWRLRRATRIERGMMESALRAAGYGRPFLPSVPMPEGAEPAADERPAPRYFTLGRELAARLCADEACGRLARYEAHIERGLWRALRELRLLRQQAARGEWACADAAEAGEAAGAEKRHAQEADAAGQSPAARETETPARATQPSAREVQPAAREDARPPRGVFRRPSRRPAAAHARPAGNAADVANTVGHAAQPDKVGHAGRRDGAQHASRPDKVADAAQRDGAQHAARLEGAGHRAGADEAGLRNEPNPEDGAGHEGKVRNEANRAQPAAAPAS